MPDLIGVTSLLPHLPINAFKSLSKKEVNIHILLIINGLQPTGGLWNDTVGCSRALRRLLGTGQEWVRGGHYEAQSSESSQCVSSTTSTVKVSKILFQPQSPLT